MPLMWKLRKNKERFPSISTIAWKSPKAGFPTFPQPSLLTKFQRRKTRPFCVRKLDTLIKTTFNGRDQATLIREYQGADTSTTYQDKIATFDGHGRLATSHVPEQRDYSNNLKYTTYSYNLDDSISSVTDGRGVVENRTYNNRGLLILKSWNVGSTGVPDPPDVEFDYDNAGNRIEMTDALGTVDYAYNSLSQLTSETREFTAITGESFPISYTYTIGGQLKTLTDPNDRVVTYAHYKNGKLDTVNGTGFELNVPFVSDVAYRAWGGVKEITYGNGVEASLAYNSKLLPASYELTNFNVSGTIGATYGYNNDGRLKSVENLGPDIFDRAYTYDFAGRLKTALTGDEARGGTTADGPFKHSYSYDVWGNTTTYVHREWTGSTITDNISVTNNRRSDYSYDLDGRVVGAQQLSHQYDAASHRKNVSSYDTATGSWGTLPVYETTNTYTGDQIPSKQVTTTRVTGGSQTTTSTYHVSSTVLGGNPIGEFDAEGDWVSSTIYADGMKVAVYKPKISSEYSDIMLWQHTDPVTGSPAWSGRVAETGGFAHLDPFGNDVTTGPPDPLEPPYVEPTQPFFWPLEIEGSPTNEAALGMAAYANRVNAEYDRSRAEYFWAIGRRDLAMEIVANNPNVGIEYRVTGNVNDLPEFFRHLPRAGTIFGAQAGGFLLHLNSAIQNYALEERGRPRGLPPLSSTKSCNQDPRGSANQLAIEGYLTKAGLLDRFEPSESLVDPRSIRVSREGIAFTINDLAAFNAAMANGPYRFDLNVGFPWRGQHNDQVGGPGVDNRSRTGSHPNKLGAQSLQVVVGPERTGTFKGTALGYADLDCSNPAQSLGQAIQHILGW